MTRLTKIIASLIQKGRHFLALTGRIAVRQYSCADSVHISHGLWMMYERLSKRMTLLTSIGPVKLFVNSKEVAFTAIKFERDRKRFPHINGRYLIAYDYINDGHKQEIMCCLPSLSVAGYVESGERLEALSFYQDNIKLTIAVVDEFTDDSEVSSARGQYIKNGIKYDIDENAASRKLLFGICWVQPVTEENDIQTWFGADPSLMKQ